VITSLDLVQALANGLALGAVLALTAVGLSLVYGVIGIPNFAHGDMLTCAMYAAFGLWALWGLDPLIAAPIAAVALGVLSYLLYRGVIRRVLGFDQRLILATFGASILLRGVLQLAASADTRRVEGGLVAGLRVSVEGVALSGPQLAMSAGALLTTGAIAVLVHHTRIGHALQAVGEDQQAAALMGIRPDRMFALAWILAGVTTGVGGALLITQYTVDPLAGTTFGLLSFVAVALGGFGSVLGAAAGGLALGAAQGMIGLVLPDWTMALAFMLFLAVLIARPHGLAGQR
jgi:branched-chain amino acid transport system permease protein